MYDAIINDEDFLRSAGIKKEEVAILHGGSPKGPSDPFGTNTYDGLCDMKSSLRFSPNSNIDADTPGKRTEKAKWSTDPIKHPHLDRCFI